MLDLLVDHDLVLRSVVLEGNDCFVKRCAAQMLLN